MSLYIRITFQEFIYLTYMTKLDETRYNWTCYSVSPSL